MKKNLTELVFILDRSGSMSGLESDTIGGYNSFLEKQKEEDGSCLVSTVLFNQHSKVIHDRVDLVKIEKMERKDYLASGTTALIDAMGDAIHHIKNVHKYIRKEDVPANTIFVIITDGLENASHKYSSDDVKKMVEQQKEKGWEFLFLGANIDAVETARTYGIAEDRTSDYLCDEAGIEKNFDALSKSVKSFRACGKIEADWAAPIKEDYKKRKGGN
ncbi:MAG: VWA domain-containing protein [Erysipelotrichaceae bacterium]|nr:VWA domain-containing protein [Erysipelotrichaceae bacterium]MBR4609122.1 VWA domain-containing protein [Erysipelotrichaceae bacterium]MBR6723856.1 VWA domain-containing protein [Erysipelotrichaceae bacterium]